MQNGSIIDTMESLRTVGNNNEHSCSFIIIKRYLHNNVVDWDMNQLHKEPDESHDCKSNRCCNGNFLILYS